MERLGEWWRFTEYKISAVPVLLDSDNVVNVPYIVPAPGARLETYHVRVTGGGAPDIPLHSFFVCCRSERVFAKGR